MRSLSVSPSLESKKTPKVVVIFSSPPLGCSIFAFQRILYRLFSTSFKSNIQESLLPNPLKVCFLFLCISFSWFLSLFPLLGNFGLPASPSPCLQILVILDHILHFEHCKFLGKLSCHLAGNIPQYWWSQPLEVFHYLHRLQVDSQASPKKIRFCVCNIFF